MASTRTAPASVRPPEELLGVVGEFHKVRVLHFRGIDASMEEFEAYGAHWTYGSRAGSATTPSAYYLAELDGVWYWVRFSDHWGDFTAPRHDLGGIRVHYTWVLPGGGWCRSGGDLLTGGPIRCAAGSSRSQASSRPCASGARARARLLVRPARSRVDGVTKASTWDRCRGEAAVGFPAATPAERDRIVQAALKVMAEPVFETDFLPHSYGFCPR